MELNLNFVSWGAELESCISGPVLHFCSYRFQEHANRIRYYKAVLHSKLISEGVCCGTEFLAKSADSRSTNSLWDSTTTSPSLLWAIPWLWIAAIPKPWALSPEDPLGMDTGAHTGPLMLGCCRCGCDALDCTCFISENTLSWWFCKSLGKLCLRPVCFLKWGGFLLCCSPHPLFLFIFCKFLRHRNQKCKITKSTYAGLKIEQKNQIPAKGYKAELQIIVNRDWHEVQPSIPSPAVAVGWGSVSRAGTSDASPLLLPRLQLFSAQGLCARSDFCVDSKHE